MEKWVRILKAQEAIKGFYMEEKKLSRDIKNLRKDVIIDITVIDYKYNYIY